jgi:hypothetical protein
MMAKFWKGGKRREERKRDKEGRVREERKGKGVREGRR